jgi:hypothetical protein
MLLPTSVDLLRCVERTLQTVIVPTLAGTAERSAARTIEHILRHVVLRIEHEGRIFSAEIDLLRPLLERARGVFDQDFGAAPAAAAARAAVAAALSFPVPTQAYRDVASLASEVTALRQAVCDALRLLQQHEAALSASAKDLYAALQRYIAWELDNEAQLIDPAFEGFGARR